MGVHDHELSENVLLSAMPEGDRAWLAERMTHKAMPLGALLHDAGDAVTHAFFPCAAALASYGVAARAVGVEAALIGHEGALGGVIAPGGLPAYSRAEVQFAGPFLQIDIADLRTAEDRSPPVRRIMACYGDCLFAQVLQSAACNAVHSIEQRAAKWLVAASERTGSAIQPITQDRLAGMLGVGRSFVNRVLRGLREGGLVDSRRGALIVRDVDGLRRLACDCDDRVKAHFATVMASAIR